MQTASVCPFDSELAASMAFNSGQKWPKAHLGSLEGFIQQFALTTLLVSSKHLIHETQTWLLYSLHPCLQFNWSKSVQFLMFTAAAPVLEQSAPSIDQDVTSGHLTKWAFS